MNCLHDDVDEPSTEPVDSGTLDRPRHGPFDRHASQDLWLACHREVARAIG